MTQPTQPTQPANETDSLSMAQLKVLLRSSNNEALEGFLHGYSVGFAAHQFINIMVGPNQRIEFLIAIAKTYPEDWKQAVEILGR